jgi:hypothetical protein
MHWPFADPPNFVAYSTRAVMERSAPILFVSHEADDGAWQFLNPDWEPDDLVVICLQHALQQDPSIAALADLPRSWSAERQSPVEPWRRAPLEADPDGGT